MCGKIIYVNKLAFLGSLDRSPGVPGQLAHNLEKKKYWKINLDSYFTSTQINPKWTSKYYTCKKQQTQENHFQISFIFGVGKLFSLCCKIQNPQRKKTNKF